MSFLPSYLLKIVMETEARVNEFRCPRVYDKTLGDLIMKTCAEVHEVPIVMVTSNESVPSLLFVPEKFSSKESIFVAFHFYGAGHYDSTRKAEEGKLSRDIIAKLNVFISCYRRR